MQNSSGHFKQPFAWVRYVLDLTYFCGGKIAIQTSRTAEVSCFNGLKKDFLGKMYVLKNGRRVDSNSNHVSGCRGKLVFEVL